MTFDQDRADKLIGQIGALVLDGDLSDQPWEQAVMVADFHNRQRMFGYCFWGDDEWEAATPDGFEALELAKQLQQATTVPGAAAWRRMKLTVDRGSRRIGIAFDYDGDKWTPDVTDPAGFARRLLTQE